MEKVEDMNKAEIMAFLNSNPVCRLATLDGDQPRVRGMMHRWTMATNMDPKAFVAL